VPVGVEVSLALTALIPNVAIATATAIVVFLNMIFSTE
jgi:hypothetical protein